MNRVRLLPIVIVAASGLMVLKSTALITKTDLIFASDPAPKKIMTEDDLPRFGRALAKLRFVPPADAEITGSVPPKKKEEAKREAKSDGKTDAKPAADAQTQKVAEQKPVQPLPPAQNSASERAVLERLQERRGSIEERGREMEMRENLLKAAERKVDGKINELKEIENRIDSGAKAQQAEADKQMKMVVVMYETMKPKEAARVFDRLNLQVLVPIATAMKPARMSEILAAMTPESAEKLTVALASKARDAGPASSANLAGGAATPAGELPRIDQPAAAAPARPRR
ncbi:MAG: MotE family protein [Beijerinckiaceae bacterium]